MRWTYERWEAKCERLKRWHDWFAWYPVCRDGQGAWLCRIRRRALPWNSDGSIWRPDGLVDWEYDLGFPPEEVG